MALTSFAAVQQFLNDFVQNNHIDLTGSPHAAFWNTMTYDNFIKCDVPGVQDPNGDPLPILNKINGKYDGPSSNIVMALAGDSPLFTKGDQNAPIGQMPYPNGPYMSPAQIQEISDWISAQCPK
jgi:hypothetical protein